MLLFFFNYGAEEPHDHPNDTERDDFHLAHRL